MTEPGHEAVIDKHPSMFQKTYVAILVFQPLTFIGTYEECKIWLHYMEIYDLKMTDQNGKVYKINRLDTFTIRPTP